MQNVEARIQAQAAELAARWADDDRIVQAVSGGESSTLALRGSTEEAQFHSAA